MGSAATLVAGDDATGAILVPRPGGLGRGRPAGSGRAAPEQHAGDGHRGDQDADAPGDRHPGAAPTGRPSSRPRRVSMTGVTGWLAAKPCSQPGMVSIGTKALLG